MKTSEVLYEAANLVELHGLGFGTQTWVESDGPICAEGALAAAAGLTMVDTGFSLGETILAPKLAEKHECPAFRAVHEYLGLSQGTEVWEWNDEFDFDLVRHVRTADEVIATLRAAAVIEAAKEQAAVDTPAVSAAPVRSAL